MNNPFDSPRRKLSWAKKHFNDLEGAVDAFMEKAKYTQFTEPHPDKPGLVIYKVRMTDRLPPGIEEVAGDAINNLREALDHAVFAVCIASGVVDPKYAYFPFAGDETRIDQKINGNCKDVPPEFIPTLKSFKPYGGGNGNAVLFTLNRIANANKHRLLVDVGSVVWDAGMNVEGTGFMTMPVRHVWDRAKNEMELITLGAEAKFQANFRFAHTITFDGIEGLESEPALDVLGTIGLEVERVVDTLEDKARSLGYIK